MKRLTRIWHGITKPAGAALLGLLAAVVLTHTAWAQATLLQQVTVETSRYGTELKLHAEQPIQHRVLQATDSVLVLELKDVSTPRTVRTDFSKADDVRHVIFQPNGGNNLKMTIRGERLGKPLVQVVYPQPMAYSQPPAPIAEAAPKQVTPVAKPAPMPTIAAKAAQTTVAEAPPRALVVPAASTPVSVAEPTQPAPAAPVAAAAWESAPDTTDLLANTNNTLPAVSSSNLALGELLAMVNGLPLGAIASGAVILVMLGGLVWFARRKLASLSGTMAHTLSEHLPSMPAQQAPLNKRSFKELAEQRRAKREGADHHFNPRQHPRKANAYAQRPKTRLHQPVNHAPQTVDKQALKQNQLKQAMQQYQTQQAPPVAKPKRQPLPPVADPIQPMNFERLSRNEATHRASNPPPKPKAHAALPQPKAGEPLPANPNVLNFLRDVAAYMEQDGDKHRARAVSKSLRNYD